MISIEKWDFSLSHPGLLFSEDDRAVKWTADGISLIPAALALLPSRLCSLTVLLANTPKRNGSISFGLGAISFPSSGTDEFGSRNDSWGIRSSRGRMSDSVIATNGVWLSSFRSLEEGDVLRIEINIDASSALLIINNVPVHKFKIPRREHTDYVVGCTLCNDLEVSILSDRPLEENIPYEFEAERARERVARRPVSASATSAQHKKKFVKDSYGLESSSRPASAGISKKKQANSTPSARSKKIQGSLDYRNNIFSAQHAEDGNNDYGDDGDIDPGMRVVQHNGVGSRVEEEEVSFNIEQVEEMIRKVLWLRENKNKNAGAEVNNESEQKRSAGFQGSGSNNENDDYAYVDENGEYQYRYEGARGEAGGAFEPHTKNQFFVKVDKKLLQAPVRRSTFKGKDVDYLVGEPYMLRDEKLKPKFSKFSGGYRASSTRGKESGDVAGNAAVPRGDQDDVSEYEKYLPEDRDVGEDELDVREYERVQVRDDDWGPTPPDDSGAGRRKKKRKGQ